MSKKVFVLATILTCLTQLVSASSGSNRLSPGADPELARREAMTKAWFNALTRLVERTGDQEARIVFGFLHANYRTCRPTADGAECDPSRADQKLSIIPLLESDLGVSEAWTDFLRSNTIAIYLPTLKAIIVRSPRLFSEAFTSLTLFHEGTHAFDRFQRNFHGENSAEQGAKDELKIQSSTKRLLLKIAGQSYQNLMNELVPQLYLGFQKTRRLEPLDFHAKYDSRLDKLFGQARFRGEQLTRLDILRLHSFFEMLDRYYPKNSRELKERHFRSKKQHS